MKTDLELNREWILSRYGPISINKPTMVVAAVPVWGGVAIGIGTTEADAIQRLRYDLSSPPHNAPEAGRGDLARNARE